MLDGSIVSYVLSELERLSPILVYVVVAVLVFGEAALFVGFVFPGETAVIVAGVVASRGQVNVVVVAVVVVAAAIAGDSVGYEVGRKYGHRLVELPVIRRRRVTIARALEGLRRRGPLYVFSGRFTAFLRAIMPGLAGMSGLAYRRFLWANALGALVWGVGYTLLGFYAGGALTSIENYSSWLTWGLLAVFVAALALTTIITRRHEQGADAAWRDDSTERFE